MDKRECAVCTCGPEYNGALKHVFQVVPIQEKLLGMQMMPP